LKEHQNKLNDKLDPSLIRKRPFKSKIQRSLSQNIVMLFSKKAKEKEKEKKKKEEEDWIARENEPKPVLWDNAGAGTYTCGIQLHKYPQGTSLLCLSVPYLY